MENNNKQVLAIYDVRGIQSYIFKTPKVKDAIGASFTIENIIGEALKKAVEKLAIEQDKVALDWCNDENYYKYEEDVKKQKKIEVLFIGGGNAYVLFENEELGRKVNRFMSKYVLDKTYSLQLAIAMVEKTGNYAEDYQRLRETLVRVKENMKLSKPLSALPIMKIEANTGYPIREDKQIDGVNVSLETYEKKCREKELRSGLIEQEKQYEQLVLNSKIAVVHMDGNNMGLRIRSLVQGISDYTKAINKMREISFYINNSYKKVFENMAKHFNKEKQRVIKVLVAGDDITYVCTAEWALATVEYFCKNIVKYTMIGERDCQKNMDDIKQFGFSVCAGIAYMGSHFPFYIAYEVAEECCDSAKERAKNRENMDICKLNDGTPIERVLNFVDFQMCKNIQAVDLDAVREKEYITALGEQLCIRPYYIKTDADYGNQNEEKYFSFTKLKEAICYFQNEKNIPRSFAKELRNTYSMGENRVVMLQNFLRSRNHKMPNRSNESYIEEKEEKIAKWYDALELMDLYKELEEVTGGEQV